jgi:hypothetical protein
MKYGIAKERSEGTYYLMVPCETREGWWESVAVYCGSVWKKASRNNYMVLSHSIRELSGEDEDEAKLILENLSKQL